MVQFGANKWGDPVYCHNGKAVEHAQVWAVFDRERVYSWELEKLIDEKGTEELAEGFKCIN